jgi:hypothetical protein
LLTYLWSLFFLHFASSKRTCFCPSFSMTWKSFPLLLPSASKSPDLPASGKELCAESSRFQSVWKQQDNEDFGIMPNENCPQIF